MRKQVIKMENEILKIILKPESKRTHEENISFINYISKVSGQNLRYLLKVLKLTK